ncbi:MAG: tetratricopeptide repeat protein [Candidatus Omnitrophica bacterium]|nr:tetratricopeptide repeat protein [Candidatus Omnitrophota bacterium]
MEKAANDATLEGKDRKVTRELINLYTLMGQHDKAVAHGKKLIEQVTGERADNSNRQKAARDSATVLKLGKKYLAVEKFSAMTAARIKDIRKRKTKDARVPEPDAEIAEYFIDRNAALGQAAEQGSAKVLDEIISELNNKPQVQQAVLIKALLRDFAEGTTEEVVARLEKFLAKVTPGQPAREHILLALAKAYAKKKDMDKAVNTLLDFFKIANIERNARIEAFLLRSSIHIESAQYNEAWNDIQAAYTLYKDESWNALRDDTMKKQVRDALYSFAEALTQKDIDPAAIRTFSAGLIDTLIDSTEVLDDYDHLTPILELARTFGPNAIMTLAARLDAGISLPSKKKVLTALYECLKVHPEAISRNDAIAMTARVLRYINRSPDTEAYSLMAVLYRITGNTIKAYRANRKAQGVVERAPAYYLNEAKKYSRPGLFTRRMKPALVIKNLETAARLDKNIEKDPLFKDMMFRAQMQKTESLNRRSSSRRAQFLREYIDGLKEMAKYTDDLAARQDILKRTIQACEELVRILETNAGEVQKRYRTIAELNKARIEVLLQLGQTYGALWKTNPQNRSYLDAARGFFNDVLNLDAQNAAALTGKNDIAFFTDVYNEQSGRISSISAANLNDLMLNAYEKDLKKSTKPEEKIKLLKKMIELKPDDRGLLRQLAAAHMDLLEYDEAKKIIERALEQAKKDGQGIADEETLQNDIKKHEESIAGIVTSIQTVEDQAIIKLIHMTPGAQDSTEYKQAVSELRRGLSQSTRDTVSVRTTLIKFFKRICGQPDTLSREEEDNAQAAAEAVISRQNVNLAAILAQPENLNRLVNALEELLGRHKYALLWRLLNRIEKHKITDERLVLLKIKLLIAEAGRIAQEAKPGWERDLADREKAIEKLLNPAPGARPLVTDPALAAEGRLKFAHYYKNIAWRITDEARRNDVNQKAADYFKQALDSFPMSIEALEGLAGIAGTDMDVIGCIKIMIRTTQNRKNMDDTFKEALFKISFDLIERQAREKRKDFIAEALIRDMVTTINDGISPKLNITIIDFVFRHKMYGLIQDLLLVHYTTVGDVTAVIDAIARHLASMRVTALEGIDQNNSMTSKIDDILTRKQTIAGRSFDLMVLDAQCRIVQAYLHIGNSKFDEARKALREPLKGPYLIRQSARVSAIKLKIARGDWLWGSLGYRTRGLSPEAVRTLDLDIASTKQEKIKPKAGQKKNPLKQWWDGRSVETRLLAALKRDSSDVDTLAQLFEHYMTNNKYESALYTAISLMRAYAKQGRHEDARDFFDRHIQALVSNPRCARFPLTIDELTALYRESDRLAREAAQKKPKAKITAPKPQPTQPAPPKPATQPQAAQQQPAQPAPAVTPYVEPQNIVAMKPEDLEAEIATVLNLPAPEKQKHLRFLATLHNALIVSRIETFLPANHGYDNKTIEALKTDWQKSLPAFAVPGDLSTPVQPKDEYQLKTTLRNLLRGFASMKPDIAHPPLEKTVDAMYISIRNFLTGQPTQEIQPTEPGKPITQPLPTPAAPEQPSQPANYTFQHSFDSINNMPYDLLTEELTTISQALRQQQFGNNDACREYQQRLLNEIIIRYLRDVATFELGNMDPSDQTDPQKRAEEQSKTVLKIFAILHDQLKFYREGADAATGGKTFERVTKDTAQETIRLFIAAIDIDFQKPAPTDSRDPDVAHLYDRYDAYLDAITRAYINGEEGIYIPMIVVREPEKIQPPMAKEEEEFAATLETTIKQLTELKAGVLFDRKEMKINELVLELRKALSDLAELRNKLPTDRQAQASQDLSIVANTFAGLMDTRLGEIVESVNVLMNGIQTPKGLQIIDRENPGNLDETKKLLREVLVYRAILDDTLTPYIDRQLLLNLTTAIEGSVLGCNTFMSQSQAAIDEKAGHEAAKAKTPAPREETADEARLIDEIITTSPDTVITLPAKTLGERIPVIRGRIEKIADKKYSREMKEWQNRLRDYATALIVPDIQALLVGALQKKGDGTEADAQKFSAEEGLSLDILNKTALYIAGQIFELFLSEFRLSGDEKINSALWNGLHNLQNDMLAFRRQNNIPPPSKDDQRFKAPWFAERRTSILRGIDTTIASLKEHHPALFGPAQAPATTPSPKPGLPYGGNIAQMPAFAFILGILWSICGWMVNNNIEPGWFGTITVIVTLATLIISTIVVTVRFISKKAEPVQPTVALGILAENAGLVPSEKYPGVRFILIKPSGRPHDELISEFEQKAEGSGCPIRMVIDAQEGVTQDQIARIAQQANIQAFMSLPFVMAINSSDLSHMIRPELIDIFDRIKAYITPAVSLKLVQCNLNEDNFIDTIAGFDRKVDTSTAPDPADKKGVTDWARDYAKALQADLSIPANRNILNNMNTALVGKASEMSRQGKDVREYLAQLQGAVTATAWATKEAADEAILAQVQAILPVNASGVIALGEELTDSASCRTLTKLAQKIRSDERYSKIRFVIFGLPESPSVPDGFTYMKRDGSVTLIDQLIARFGRDTRIVVHSVKTDGDLPDIERDIRTSYAPAHVIATPDKIEDLKNMNNDISRVIIGALFHSAATHKPSVTAVGEYSDDAISGIRKYLSDTGGLFQIFKNAGQAISEYFQAIKQAAISV